MTRSQANHNLYTFIEGGLYIIIILYVDDLLLIGNHANKLAFVEAQPKQKFEMSKLRIMHAYIGMQILYLSLGIVMC